MDIVHSPFWILLAKTLLAFIMFAFALVCLIVWRNAPAWRESLAELEYECNVVRDETMMQATIARGQLVEIQERMRQRNEKAEIEVVGTLVRQAVPLLTMLMQRETNLMKWGMAGAKLVKSAFEYFNSKNS